MAVCKLCRQGILDERIQADAEILVGVTALMLSCCSGNGTYSPAVGRELCGT